MIKRILFSFVLILLLIPLSAQQGKTEKTVLFLIPFHTQDYTGSELTSVRSSRDINGINSFLLMGFWNGAQIALEEYEEKNVSLHVIVRDVTENLDQLRNIMEDKTLMDEVDLIVGPFFSKPFTIAAEYAKRYQIPIVNPFTNLTSILDHNPYVYKLVPSMELRPAMVCYVADQYPQHKIIIYEDSSVRNAEQQVYTQYFKEHKIAFKSVKTQQGLLNEMMPQGKNIVITFCHNAAKMLVLSRDLLYKAKNTDLMLVVPEAWLQAPAYDVEYYSKLNIHFFSNYFVDEQDPETQVFEQKYKSAYKSIPSLDNFAYQGYDITRFFVEMLLNDGDIDRAKITPIACPISFDQVKDGGYENINMQFLEVVDDEIRSVTF